MPPLLTRISPFVIARTQRRRLHLVHEIFTKHPNGKLAACKKQKLELQPKPFRIKTPSGVVTLNSVREAFKYIKPMTHLMKVDGKQIYQVTSLELPPPLLDERGNLRELPGPRKGSALEIQLTTGCSSADLKSVLSRAYQALLSKRVDFRRVEFHVKVKEDNTNTWALKNCAHLRPEIILAAMPEDTLVLAPLLADGRSEMMWALHRMRTPLELEEKRAENIARGLMKGGTTSWVDDNQDEELDLRDLKVRDFSESNTSTRRQPHSVVVGNGIDIDKPQAATDVSRSETKEEKSRDANLRMIQRYEKVWDTPSKWFNRTWKRKAWQGSKRFLKKQEQRRRRVAKKGENRMKEQAEAREIQKLRRKREKEEKKRKRENKRA